MFKYDRVKWCTWAILVVGLGSVSNTGAQEQPEQSQERPWWNAGFPSRPRPLSGQDKLPRISVEGNKFVDPDGKTVLLRGLSIADPDKVDGQGHWNKAHFEHVQETGAKIVRLPVHPVAWRSRTPQGYIELLDQAVEWCTELGMYVIIDWHSIGNLSKELFQNPMYDTTQRETYEFWRAIARRYNGHNTVAFYELFNEPTTYRGQLGTVSWHEWKKLNENMIALIRAYDPDTVILVAGLDWAYDLTPLLEEPIAATGIGYVTHPYAHKRSQPWEPKWEENFGFAANRYPIVATEFGFGGRRESAEEGTQYGRRIVDYLEGKGISWVAWCYDPQWGPRMLRSWDYDLTPSGEFFKAEMSKHRKKSE